MITSIDLSQEIFIFDMLTALNILSEESSQACSAMHKDHMETRLKRHPAITHAFDK